MYTDCINIPYSVRAFCILRRKLRRENTRIQKFKNPKDVKMYNPIIDFFKNRKIQISKRCENVKFNNRIIQKSKSSNIQKM